MGGRGSVRAVDEWGEIVGAFIENALPTGTKFARWANGLRRGQDIRAVARSIWWVAPYPLETPPNPALADTEPHHSKSISQSRFRNLRLPSRVIPNILRLFHGLWLSLVERLVRDEEVAGSNPVSPIF